ncbi:MAG: hypothetical protein H0V93_14130 [Euzebyales bacterium]|jgi:hypothetical protein|nr:hypothetical protein [Euzebyales bacterium]
MRGPVGVGEPGPRPFVRAVLGLALGFVAGVIAAALIPREREPGGGTG